MSSMHTWQQRASIVHIYKGQWLKVKCDLEAQLDEEISLRKGDVVYCTDAPVDDAWCRVVTQEKEPREGLCPIGFVDIIERSGQQSTHDDRSIGRTGKIIADFDAEFDNELTVREGDVVEVTAYVDDEWTHCSIDGRSGIVPRAYVDLEWTARSADRPEVSPTPPIRYSSTNPFINQIEDVIPPSASHANVTLEQDYSNPSTPFPVVSSSEVIAVGRCAFDYESGVAGDLICTAGDVIDVHRYNDEDWMTATNRTTGETGVVPINFVDFDDAPTEGVKWRDTYDEHTPFVHDDLDRMFGDSSPKPATSSEALYVHMPPVSLSNATTPASPRQSVRPSASSPSAVEPTVTLCQPSTSLRPVIREMCDAEARFVEQCELCEREFKRGDRAAIDVDTIVDGLADVIKLANTILGELRKLQGDMPDVGAVFVALRTEFGRTYERYCQCNDKAISLLDNYAARPPAKAAISACVQRMRTHNNQVIDVHSVLCKPIQHILRYPLYFQQLLKHVPLERSTLHENLIAATQMMDDLARTVNESKRRRELGLSTYILKYRRPKERSLPNRLAKLNMHSVQKKSSRLTTRLSTSLGFRNIDDDPQFGKIEQDYRQMQRVLHTITKQLRSTVHADRQLTEVRASATASMSALCSVTCAQATNATQQRSTATLVTSAESSSARVFQVLSTEWMRSLEARCQHPLHALTDYCSAPDALIEKRMDKLIDYVAVGGRAAEAGGQDLLRIRHAEYEALNKQLIEELPKLTKAAYNVIHAALTAYATTNEKYAADVERSLTAGISTNLRSSCADDALLTFHTSFDAGLWRLANLSSIQGKIDPYARHAKADSVDEPTAQPNRFSMNLFSRGTTRRSKRSTSTNATPSPTPKAKEGVDVITKYGANRVYQVLNDVRGAKATPQILPVRQGELVGVLVMKDPMGDDRRWFVDNGVEKGFVDRHNLKPYSDGTNAAFVQSPQSHLPPPRPIVQPNSVVDAPLIVLDVGGGRTEQCHLEDLMGVDFKTVGQSTFYGVEEEKEEKEEKDIMGDNNTFPPSPAPQPQLQTEVLQLKPNYCIDIAEEVGRSSVDWSPSPLSANQRTMGDTVENSPVRRAPPPPPHKTKHCIVKFDFSPTDDATDSQLRLKANDRVTLLDRCDIGGNAEWWLVGDAEGGKGYVPSDYLHVL